MADLRSILRANAEICCRHHRRRLPPVGFFSRQVRHGLAIRQRLSPLSSLYLAVQVESKLLKGRALEIFELATSFSANLITWRW
jgi:hypothetical protein